MEKAKKGDNYLVWLDMEMTGLGVDNNRILEVATIITDPNLNVVAEGPVLHVHQSDDILAGMDEWNSQHHADSGLTEKVKASDIDEEKASEILLEFISTWCEPQTAVLAGNSIWYDKSFLQKYLPKVASYLHYRMVDVTTIKRLARYWYPDMEEFKKKKLHTALDDIKESIEELKYYRKNIFK